MSDKKPKDDNLVTESKVMNVHLFNCDRTYKFGPVHKLLKDVEENSKYSFEVEEHYFPLPRMKETCAYINENKMEFAIFVVHANESRLSLNEDKAGIGYAKIYRALLGATDDRVLIVIGGDEYYKGEENSQVLSRWARMKISSQFSPEFLDGRKSFVFSWENQHRYIHLEALIHFLDKSGKTFVPTPRPLPAGEGSKYEVKEQTKASVVVQKDKVWDHSRAIDPQVSKKVVGSKPAAVALRTGEAKRPSQSSSASLSEAPQHRNIKTKPESFQSTHETEANRLPITDHYIETNAKVNEPITNSWTNSVIHSTSTFLNSAEWNDGEKRKKEKGREHFKAAQQVIVPEEQQARIQPLSVNVAVIECGVFDQSVQVAHAFFYQVASILHLKPHFHAIRGKTPEELVRNLVRHGNIQFRFIVLLVEKEKLDEISAGKEDITSYINLLEEVQANAESQAILIVCNDKSQIPKGELQSKSVHNFLAQLQCHISIDPRHWVTFSWDEFHEDFSSQEYETYLVKLVQMAEAVKDVTPQSCATRSPCKPPQSATKSGVYPSAPPPDIQSEWQTGGVPYFSPLGAYANASERRKVYKNGKLLLWEGILNFDQIATKYMQPGWQPTETLFKLLKDNCDNSFVNREFQVLEDHDKSVSLVVDSHVKAFWDKFTKNFRGRYA